MTIWFTADNHFGHKNIIKYCNRPFKSAADMDQAMIANWNRVVHANDMVFHLGDVAFMEVGKAKHILQGLHGKIVLITGNHDKTRLETLPRWEAVHNYLETTIEGQRIVLSHYAMEDWNGAFHGSWMLHGHSHGRLDKGNNRVDVGVDCWNYTPVSFEELKRGM